MCPEGCGEVFFVADLCLPVDLLYEGGGHVSRQWTSINALLHMQSAAMDIRQQHMCQH